MIFPRIALSAVLASLAASVIAADLKVVAPGGSALWWIAQSDNNLAWNCRDTTVQNFTVLVGNQSPSILPTPQAIIAIQYNYDCIKLITKDQINQPAGSGYYIQLANPLNSTDVYAQSDIFEIKPLGSSYPDASATPNLQAPASTASSFSATGSSVPSSSAAPSGNSNSGASSLQAAMGGFVAIAAAAAGLVFA